MAKQLWQELATVQLQLEQVEAKLTPLAEKHAQAGCCTFCDDLRTAAENIRQAVSFLSHATASERQEASSGKGGR